MIPSSAVAVLNRSRHGVAGSRAALRVAAPAVPTMSQSCPVREPNGGAVLMAFTLGGRRINPSAATAPIGPQDLGRRDPV